MAWGVTIALGLTALVEAATQPLVWAKPASAGWPEGTQELTISNLDGVLLLPALLRGAAGRDTSGDLVLDTGAGYLALDRGLGPALGLSDSAAAPGTIAVLSRPLPRLQVGALQFDQVTPLLVLDTDVVRRVTGREVLGLLGQRPLAGWIVCIDYQRERLAFVPPSGAGPAGPASAASRRAPPGLSTAARPFPFQLAGDGKLLVRGRLHEGGRGRRSAASLTLVLDTGASKTVLFEPALTNLVPASGGWPSLRGLVAPTLMGSDEARMVRVPRLEIEGPSGPAQVSDMDAAVMTSELAAALTRGAGVPVHGLLGYSFLRHFRVAIDFPHEVVWLDPVSAPRDARPYEYSQIGLQVERADSAIVVVAVAADSPAKAAGLAPKDEIESLDGVATRAMSVLDVARALEGPPRSRVTLVVKRGEVRRTLTIARRRLL